MLTVCGKGSHPEKKAAYFWTFSKRGGGGFNPNPKVLGYFFLAFFWTFSKKGGGDPILKVLGYFWGSFRYFLGCLEVFFGGMFFPKSA